MKITDVKVWLVQGIKYNWTLLKIYTDRRLYRCRRGYQLAGKPHRIRGGKTYRQSHYRT